MDIAMERIAKVHDNTLALAGLKESPPISIDAMFELHLGSTTLELSGLGLTELPQLVSEGKPSTLVELYCGRNALTYLPPRFFEGLPNLKILICCSNKLTELPSLPPTLEKLQCGNNALTHLPPLPISLKVLTCDNNALTHLPPLPVSLKVLTCQDNAITYLPPLPHELDNLQCDYESMVYPPPKKFNYGLSNLKTWMEEHPHHINNIGE
jgi:hypothetical protein